jgi:UDP-glucose 4-epimerase
VGITVAVTGPTGEIGTAAVSALERDSAVDRVLGMARRPFDPRSRGWVKTEYRRGDVLDARAVRSLVDEADVVVHLAFQIMGDRRGTSGVNLAGSRNVFEATVDSSRARRLVYTSSVAAYGYHRDNPSPLTEDVAVRGTPAHYYSQQKSDLEGLLADLTVDSDLEVYVLRPSIVAGPRATALADFMPWNRGPLSPLMAALGHVFPPLRPLVPDPGVVLQLVHHDDVASAIRLAALGRGRPGAYNLAGDGVVTLSEVYKAVGGRGVPVPHGTVTAASNVIARLPRTPWVVEWIHAGRAPVIVDTAKVKRELQWRPTHTSAETLAAMAAVLPGWRR